MFHVVGTGFSRKDARKNLGLESFYSAVEHFGKVPDFFQRNGLDTRLFKGCLRTPGCDDLDAVIFQGGSELCQPGLVVDY